MKNAYIDLLEYGAQNILNEVNQEEVKKFLKNKGHNFDFDKGEAQFKRMYYDVFTDPNGKGQDPSFTNLESYFRYIAYLELKDARRSSNVATILSLFAISIAIAAIVLQYFFVSTIRIENEQFKEFLKNKSIIETEKINQSDN